MTSTEDIGAGVAIEPAPGPDGAKPYEREQLVAECRRRLEAEGMAEFAAELLANMYATTYEVQLFRNELAPFLEWIRGSAGKGRGNVLGVLARLREEGGGRESKQGRR